MLRPGIWQTKNRKEKEEEDSKRKGKWIYFLLKEGIVECETIKDTVCQGSIMIGGKREVRVEVDGNSVQMNKAEKQHGGGTYRSMWVRPQEEGRQWQWAQWEKLEDYEKDCEVTPGSWGGWQDRILTVSRADIPIISCTSATGDIFGYWGRRATVWKSYLEVTQGTAVSQRPGSRSRAVYFVLLCSCEFQAKQDWWVWRFKWVLQMVLTMPEENQSHHSSRKSVTIS